MENNRYFAGGERIALDTRNLERVGANPSQAAVRRYQKKVREKQVRKAWTGVRLIICAFSGWFAFNHIGAVMSNGLLLLEVLGVIAGLGFIAITMADMYEEREGKTDAEEQ